MNNLFVGIALIFLYPGSFLAGWIKGYKSVPPYEIAKAFLRPVPTEKEWEKLKILRDFKVAGLWLLRTTVVIFTAGFLLSHLISNS